MTVWRLVHARAVCGLVVHDGVVVEAAPYLARYKGSRWPDVRADLQARGWHGAPIRLRREEASP